MGDQPKVHLKGLTKSYGPVRAVAGVELEIQAGEFLTLLGPSGCGKTTTLMMIAGFESPSSGQVFLDGRDITSLPSYKRPVNTVFQNYALFPHMTVFENVAFALRMRKTPEPEVRRLVEEYLALVQLSGYERRYPRQLSGGQQQRVALARAVAAKPEVLLLDEPLGALDLRLRREMQVELKGLQRRLGITFVYVTHDQEEALTMSDRIVVMNEGRIEQVGTGAEIYERPSTRFVAEFIGETNLVPLRPNRNAINSPFFSHLGQTTSAYASSNRMNGNGLGGANGSGHGSHDDSGYGSGLESGCGSGLESGHGGGLESGRESGRESGHGDLFASIRPERIRRAQPGEPGLTGRVVDTIYVGSGVKLIVAIPEMDVALRVLVAPHNDLALSTPGEEISLAWDPKDMVVVG